MPALQTPAVTPLDAVTQTIAALVYLAIAIAAWARAPLDVRTRAFLGTAVCNTAAFGLPVFAWWRGLGTTQFSRWMFGMLITVLALGALLLLHFTQVFPRRRPWIRGAPWQLPVAYLLAPAVIIALIAGWPADAQTVSPVYIALMFVFGFPLLVTLALVVPVAGILSLLKSYREVDAYATPGLRQPLLWILVSQVAGGALATVFAPVIAVIAPNTALQGGLTIVIWALGLLTPLAYAAAVWRYDVLSVPVD